MVTRLTGGNSPGDGADPRTFPKVYDELVDAFEAVTPVPSPAAEADGRMLHVASGALAYTDNPGASDTRLLNVLSDAAGVVVWDDFVRAEGPLGTSASGHAWTTVTGTFGVVVGGVAKRASGTDPAIAVVDMGAVTLRSSDSHSAVVAVTMDTPEPVSDARILLRYIDANNYLFAQNVSNGTIRISKRDGGVETQLAATSGQNTLTTMAGRVRLAFEIDRNFVRLRNDVTKVQLATVTLGSEDYAKFGNQTVVGLAEYSTVVSRTTGFSDFVARRDL